MDFSMYNFEFSYQGIEKIYQQLIHITSKFQQEILVRWFGYIWVLKDHDDEYILKKIKQEQ